MIFKSVFVVLVVYFLSESAYGQKAQKFFRKDYSYVESEKSFYKIHTTPRKWDAAKKVCALEGASLWYPENHDEADAVISFWNNTKPHIKVIYLGISDKMAKGLFETIDGKAISEVYNVWERGQPNNYAGIQDCVRFYSNLGQLDDSECYNNYAFICKKSLQSLEWNYDCNMPDSGYTFNAKNDKCYKVHTTPMNWNDSYVACRLEQSNLAVITSQEDANYLVNITESTPKPRLKENYQRGIYHVGFHTRLNEGWQTVKGTPMPVDADAWLENYVPVNDSEQCGSMFYTGLLIDTDCDMKSFFICEHELANSLQQLEDST